LTPILWLVCGGLLDRASLKTFFAALRIRNGLETKQVVLAAPDRIQTCDPRFRKQTQTNAKKPRKPRQNRSLLVLGAVCKRVRARS